MKSRLVAGSLVVLIGCAATLTSCTRAVEVPVNSTATVSTELLAEQVASVYRNAESMSVQANIVQFLDESPEETQEIVCVSEMAPGRFLLKIFKDNEAQPVAEFSLSQGRLEEVRFDRVPAGEDEYHVSDALKPYGDGYIQFWDSCIFGVFVQTWVGLESGLAQRFFSIINQGTLLGEAEVDGQACYVVEKIYEWANGNQSLERLHIDKQTLLALKWEMRHFDGYDRPLWRVRTLSTSMNQFDPDGPERTWRVTRAK